MREPHYTAANEAATCDSIPLGAPVCVLAVSLRIQLPADGPEAAAEDGPGAWASPPTWERPGRLLASARASRLLASARASTGHGSWAVNQQRSLSLPRFL